jgi:Asp-tRNA(Asn)/Glu-tRNA(Gln) amidotransferase A subunit family amidase
VQEGSALAAIGTDTGGSIRVPAALCGLAGYRCSITLSTPDLWRGGYHLAASFDTLGWLYRDLADGPMLGHALFDLPYATPPTLEHLRIASPTIPFLYDCEPDVLATLHLWQSRLQSHGVRLSSFDAGFWVDSTSIYAHIQANEAAALHRGHFHHFESVIAERLAWGESLTSAELIPFHNQLAAFRASTHALFQACDYLLLPCAPVSSLVAGTDHTQTRTHMLRYTTPLSLAGLPVVTLPSFSSQPPKGGLQLVGPLGSDAALLALSASLSEKFSIDARLHS